MKKHLIIISIVAVFVASCSQPGEPFLLEDDYPHQTMRNATIMHTDSGRVQMVTWGEEIWNFDDEYQTQEFPSNVRAKFYDVDGTVSSIVVADEATSWQAKGVMHLRRNVIIEDLRDGSRTYTESLFWYENEGEVYSDVPFRRIFPDGSVQSGTSFRADDQLIHWEVTNVRWSMVAN